MKSWTVATPGAYYPLFKRQKSSTTKSDFRDRSLYKYFVDFETR
ncbi:unnamed protein product, partial [Rotaria magnacalcarata]